MQVEDIQVRTLEISHIDEEGPIGRLDPITVQVRNFRPGAGSITITCYGKSWYAGWGAMGGDTLEQFFCSASPDYLIGNLSPGLDPRRAAAHPDWEAHLKQLILRGRLGRSLSRDEARDLWGRVEMSVYLEFSPERSEDAELIRDIVGDDWYYDLPDEENPEYLYLERVVLAVQKGLRMLAECPTT